IAEAGVRACLDRVKKSLDLAFDKCRRFTFGARKSLGLDFPGRIHGQHSFFREPGKQHPNGVQSERAASGDQNRMVRSASRRPSSRRPEDLQAPPVKFLKWVARVRRVEPLRVATYQLAAL